MVDSRAMVRSTKVLAVASGGGHWVQLRRVMRAFEGSEIVYVTTKAGYRTEVGGAKLSLKAEYWIICDILIVEMSVKCRFEIM